MRLQISKNSETLSSKMKEGFLVSLSEIYKIFIEGKEKGERLGYAEITKGNQVFFILEIYAKRFALGEVSGYN
ncbi:hypothetical protein V6C32_06775 [Desulforamulus ruminis]|uniref:hypothetical protein n=1 Tax=Desulforamulus ruminis TaxID=1564 RepID=UPI00059D9FB1|nr:hypothetical protein [Desulforamulus ruminis]